jgi:hypothetical protein
MCNEIGHILVVQGQQTKLLGTVICSGRHQKCAGTVPIIVIEMVDGADLSVKFELAN